MGTNDFKVIRSPLKLLKQFKMPQWMVKNSLVPTVHEKTTLAEIIREIMPSIELVRMTNSGTEATTDSHSSCAWLYRSRQDCKI